jgi:hypothetical protein
MPELVTAADYHRIVRIDTTSTDEAITGALAEAQRLIEEYLGRQLEEAERTEELMIDRAGIVYPSAVPIASVSVPTGAEIRGHTLRGLSPDDLVTDWPAGGTTTVTYTGGFTYATLPSTIRRRIAFEAYDLLPASSVVVAVPAGAKSVSQGDASITFGNQGAPGPPGSGELSGITIRTLRPWKKRA